MNTLEGGWILYLSINHGRNLSRHLNRRRRGRHGCHGRYRHLRHLRRRRRPLGTKKLTLTLNNGLQSLVLIMQTIHTLNLIKELVSTVPKERLERTGARPQSQYHILPNGHRHTQSLTYFSRVTQIITYRSRTRVVSIIKTNPFHLRIIAISQWHHHFPEMRGLIVVVVAGVVGVRMGVRLCGVRGCHIWDELKNGSRRETVSIF